MNGTVKPGKTSVEYSSKAWGIGEYTVGLTSGQTKMSGSLSVPIEEIDK
ncbi:hypothetical protein JNUCC42_21535 [Brevibacterium sp. JNUCC-42]|nr:hypothetical protein JNUCC42_21535 [Brevibacterium sp. JNUCC-42]